MANLKGAKKSKTNKATASFVKPKKKGYIIAPGAANRTDTSFKTRQLVINDQSLERAHYFNTDAEALAQPDTKQLKEWQEQVTLACKHTTHASTKARKDAVERLRRLLGARVSKESFEIMDGLLPLIQDTVIRIWSDEDKAVREASVLLSGPAIKLLSMERVQKCIMMLLSSPRQDFRLSGRQLLVPLVHAMSLSELVPIFSLVVANMSSVGQVDAKAFKPHESISLCNAIITRVRSLIASQGDANPQGKGLQFSYEPDVDQDDSPTKIPAPVVTAEMKAKLTAMQAPLQLLISKTVAMEMANEKKVSSIRNAIKQFDLLVSDLLQPVIVDDGNK